MNEISLEFNKSSIFKDISFFAKFLKSLKLKLLLLVESLVELLVESLVELLVELLNILPNSLTVFSSLLLNSSPFITSNNLLLIPKDSLSCIFGTIENKIHCKYFQIVSLILLVIILSLYSSLKYIFGSNSLFFSFIKSSSFWYKISKNFSGNFFIEKICIFLILLYNSVSLVSYSSFSKIVMLLS